MQIQELLKRDLGQKIEEIIQLDQLDEHAVSAEINEYVATDSIKQHYRDLLEAINESRTNPTERIGVWISGFFGSGKSSFAKNLGYVLANSKVLGHSASDLFKAQVDDPAISNLIDVINGTIPIEVVMFDVQKDRAQTGQGNQSISPFVYRVLLRQLGYSEDFDLAELEISLEGEKKLEEFVERYNVKYAAANPRAEWTAQGRKSTQAWNRAGAILHEMDPFTYPTAESFAQAILQDRVQITPKLLVERSFELMARRRPGKTLVFIIDEVGQYVAYSQERLEDLRAVVETFGMEGRNRARARQVPAPTWFIVTAQERLEEVTSAIGDDRRVLLAKVQDRFPIRIDLSPSDVREVAARRVLSKTSAGEQQLSSLYQAHEGQLNAACTLERTTRASSVRKEAFVDFYPYLPHYIDLSIDIMSGIRLQPGAMRHVGGSNRTIISQVYQMLVNPRTDYAHKSPGTLVSLDRIYDLIEGQVGSSQQKDISDIVERFRGDPADGSWAGRVAKAIALLEFVRDLPRTEANIAALLVHQVGQPAPLAEVVPALKRLEEADFVRTTDQGYKLQTAQEKSWEQEKRGYQPKPRDRHEIEREILADIFGEPTLKTYRHKNLRTFAVGAAVDGTRLGAEGQIPLSILVADDEAGFSGKLEEAIQTSRDRRNDVHWVFALTPEIDDLVAGYFASSQMIAKYQQVQSQNKITSEEAASLAAERNDHSRSRSRVRDKLSEALGSGRGIFRGITKDAFDLGRTTPEIFRSLYEWVVPDLYSKLELGARAVSGKEAEDLLKAVNLQGLPPVFYGGVSGLNLVTQEGPKYVVNSSAPIAKEVLDYLKAEHSYGNKVTGKTIEQHFGGLGYGWDIDVLKLVIATLLRGGAIEMTHQGRRFLDAQDPLARQPFGSNVAFRSAAFAPRKTIDLQMLIAAANQFEQLTGKEVDDIEEGAIAVAVKTFATEEMSLLQPVISEANAYLLPMTDVLAEYRDALQEVMGAASDDAVGILAGQGNSLGDMRNKTRAIRGAVTPDNIRLIQRARVMTNDMWPVLQGRPNGQQVEQQASDVTELLAQPDLYDHLSRLDALTNVVDARYQELYEGKHTERIAAFTHAVEEAKGHPDWGQVAEEVTASVLQPLTSRACADLSLPRGSTGCTSCQATVSQMESDLAAVHGLTIQVQARIDELTTIEPIERVRLASFFTEPIDSRDAVDTAVGQLRERLLKLVEANVRVVVE